MITQDNLKEILLYDPKTGVWIWNHSGKVAGNVQKNGYRYIKIHKKLYQSSRLAHLYMTGNEPEHIIDHINGLTNDDRWENLREATLSQNQFNRRIGQNNKSGIKGVFWDKRSQRWVARLRKHGKTIYTGFFVDKNDAIAARIQSEIK